MSLKSKFLSVTTALVWVGALVAVDPCVSGLQPGQKPGPYSFLIETGANRGQSCCFICETADKPAVVVFARTPSAGLTKLAQGLDKALTTHKAVDLKAWMTFLHDDETVMGPQVVAFARKSGLRDMPVGVFEDVNGPPAYKLNREADVTVLLFVKAKVVANFAFRPSELTDDKVAEVIKSLPQIVGEK
jgi:hypothetical protein